MKSGKFYLSRRWVAGLILVAASSPSHALQEKDYQAAWCTGETEYVLPDMTRVDCIQNGYAVEVDYAHKWAESIGQSLYYASQTGLKPGILLIVGPSDYKHAARNTPAFLPKLF